MKLELLHVKHNTPEWYAMRKTGIGGSDAAAILGLSPWRTNVEVWEEKVGLREGADLSGNAAVEYGKAAEDLLVKLFALDYPQYKVRTKKSVVYRRGFMFASLDAELTDKDTGACGFLEIKTTETLTSRIPERWQGVIPQYYYAQILHYFIVTGWDFAFCKAQIKHMPLGSGQIRMDTEHYPFLRKGLFGDMRYLYEQEKAFWGYVERKERPPLVLPKI